MHQTPDGFDVLKCRLINWNGELDLCVWCMSPKPTRRATTSLWCSTWCNAQFLIQHSYTAARRACLAENGPKCYACDKVRPLTCNHKMPIKGQRKGLNCLNHADNLEMICWPCHEEATQLQIKRGLLP
jgi:hypothetical protein